MATFLKYDGFGLFACFIACSVVCTLGASPLMSFNGTQHVIVQEEHNSHQINTTVPIVFEGKSYSSFYISVYGNIMFTNVPGAAVQYHNIDWSRSGISQYIDFPFIAPYYYEAQRLDALEHYSGSISYQAIYAHDDGSLDTLNQLGKYIQSHVVGSEDFHPKWAIQVTWSNVTSSRYVEDQRNRCNAETTSQGSDPPCPSNTFQLVLMTSGTQTYVIFNYDKMDMQPALNDQAGFNAGYGQGFTSILTNSRPINDLSLEQGSDVVGRFIYRISSGKVVRGGCSNDPSYSQLSVHPNYAGMFGGKMVDVSGPCFNNARRIMCKFGDESQMKNPPVDYAIYVSDTRVRCVVPRLLVRDQVNLSISLDNGRTFQYQTTFTIVFPGRMPSSEHLSLVFTEADMGWYSHNPTDLTVKWNPDLLSNASTSLVSIALIGYNENNGKAQYLQLSVLGTDIPNTNGQYTLDAQKYQCVGQDCFNFEVGLVEVRLMNQYTPHEYRFLSSKVIPLGWYVQNTMVAKHGTNWPDRMCIDWYNKDSQDTTWLDSLLHCPCSMQQAMADFGRWQPDHGCTIERTDSLNCYYHKSAVHCVRAVQPVNGAGNQCCYGRSGSLIYAADSKHGSTPDKGHDWGAAPYGKPGYVPSLSHWIDDVVTFYYCCIWTGYKSCDYYMDLRPTRDCTGYTPATPASVYGQGHIMTFGGSSYRIYGPGDFILLKAANTMVQGRFQKNPYLNMVSRNTSYTLTSVAIQDMGTSDRVEVDMRGPSTNNQFQAIDVRVNGVYVTFNDKAMKWQDFKGVAVVNTDSSKRKSNFTVLLTNGIGLQIAAVQNTLQVDLMISGSSFSNVSGLFGDLDGNLQTQDNNMTFNTSDSPWRLYDKFQLDWAVNDTNQLFGDLLSATKTSNRQTNLNQSPVRYQSLSLCSTSYGMSEECVFDFQYTGSREMAMATATAYARNAFLKESLQPIRSCGLLHIPKTKKTSYKTVLGTSTSITSCTSGSLSGPSTYTCKATSNTTQSWSPAVTSTCAEQVEDADVGMIVGVVVAVAVVVIIAIIIAIVFVQRRKQQKRKRSGEAHTAEEMVTMKTTI